MNSLLLSILLLLNLVLSSVNMSRMKLMPANMLRNINSNKNFKLKNDDVVIISEQTKLTAIVQVINTLTRYMLIQ